MEKKSIPVIRVNAATILAIIGVIIFIPAAFAAPPEPPQRREVADAVFYRDEGCIWHYAQISSYPDHTAIFIHSFDRCTGDRISAAGMDSASVYQLAVNGYNAVLKGDFQGSKCDAYGECGDCTVSVDLRWQGNHDTTHYRSVSSSLSPTGRSFERVNLIGVSATASGSVLIDGYPIIVEGETSYSASIGITTVASKTVNRPTPR